MSSMAAIPITGGTVPTPQFMAFVAGQTSPEVLMPQLALRDSLPLPELVGQIGAAVIDVREKTGSYSQGSKFYESGDEFTRLRRNYSMTGTVFGRNYTAIERLKVGLLPERPLKILQCGAGMYPFGMLNYYVPGILKSLRDVGFESEGASYETAELVLLAGQTGRVNLIEFDKRVADAVLESLHRGMIMDMLQPLTLSGARSATEEMMKDPESVTGIYGGWIRYLNSFIVSASDRNLGVFRNDKLINFTLRPELHDVAKIHVRDIANSMIQDTYDMAWAVGIFAYLSIPIQIDLFLRLAACLPVGDGRDSFGGLMVADRFDMNPIVEDDLHGHLDELMTMAGMTMLAEFDRPLERMVDEKIFIARRTHQSPWLDEYMRRSCRQIVIR